MSSTSAKCAEVVDTTRLLVRVSAVTLNGTDGALRRPRVCWRMMSRNSVPIESANSPAWELASGYTRTSTSPPVDSSSSFRIIATVSSTSDAGPRTSTLLELVSGVTVTDVPPSEPRRYRPPFCPSASETLTARESACAFSRRTMRMVELAWSFESNCWIS